MARQIQLLLALVVGACAGSTTTLVASPPEPAPSEPATPVPVPAPAPGTATTIAASEHRIAPGGKAEIALLARGQGAFLGELRLEGLAEIPPHRDPTEEYLIVLEGGGTLLMDGRGHQLTRGSVVYMPANAEVSYANGPDPLVAIQVFAGPESADKYAQWAKVAP